MGNYAYQGAPPQASLHANFAFQDHHSQFQYNSSQNGFFAGTSVYQGFHSASSNVPLDFSAPPFFSSGTRQQGKYNIKERVATMNYLGFLCMFFQL